MLLRSFTRLMFGLGLITVSNITLGQVRIDSNFLFQTDPAKKYSLYIPSTYDSNTANKLMIGLHPLNPARWHADTWCDTLIFFAETNGLILACPDGGLDGSIDDPIDTAFTTALIDSVLLWYNIDAAEIYLMGFSRGGRATYTYGLSHASRFKGFIPIGAGVNGTAEISGIVKHGKYKPFYIVHGNNDSPNTRFYPPRDLLIDTGACVDFILMTGVGHTIDFPNRNQILTDALVWLDTVSCKAPDPPPTGIDKGVLDREQTPRIYPNPVTNDRALNLYVPQLKGGNVQIMVLNSHLNLVRAFEAHDEHIIINIEDLAPGIYFLMIDTDRERVVRKVSII